MQHELNLSHGMRVGARCAMAVVLAVALMVPTSAYADPTAADKQAEAEAVLESLNAMQATLDEASDNYYQALDEQQQAEANRDAAQARIDEIDAELADIQDRLSNRVTYMYRSGNASFLEFLLGATTFEEFATNWDLLSTINENDAQLVQQAKDLKAEAEQERATYEEQSRVAAEKAEEAKRIQDEAAATVASMQATYDSLSEEAAALLEQERAEEEAAQAAAASSVVQESVNQASSGGSTSTNTTSYNAGQGSDAVSRAYSYVGNAEYVWGACSPGCFDCSGFVSYCLTGSYSRLGTTYTFYNWGAVSDPQPGDVAVNYGHCGIYIGNGQMIHCASPGQGVIIGPVQSGMIIVRYPG